MDWITLIFGFSAILAAFCKKVRVPVIVGFLLAGMLISGSKMSEGTTEVLERFAEYGAAFLMMSVGLEIKLKHFQKIGWTVVWLAVLQLAMFFLLSYGLFRIFSYSILSAMIFSAVISFSSTILVASVLRDKREQNSLHGRVLLGILLLQDLVVAGLLLVMPYLQGEETNLWQRLGWGIAAILIIIVVGKWLFVRIRSFYRDAPEVVFLLTIAWLLLWINIFAWPEINLPAEIVGLMVGLSLANVYDVDRVANWFDPIKDYFLVFLFFYVGLNVNAQWIIHDWQVIVVFLLIIMIVKSFIGWITAGVAGLPRKVIMITGLGLANISELGFVILPLAFRLNMLTQEQLSIMSVLILGSLVLSSIVLYNTSDICNGFCGFFELLERRKVLAQMEEGAKLRNKTVLIGCHRAGWALIKNLPDGGKNLVIFDYNLSTVSKLKKMGHNAILADVGDKRFLIEMGLTKAKMILSTLPSVKENLMLLNFLKNEKERKKPYFVAMAANKHEMIELYSNGADVVFDKYVAVANSFADLMGAKNKRAYGRKVMHAHNKIHNVVL
ncbi:MAG TPA: cation:proton antiporter [bacterium]|nr:cation:proton antiporter [bacterium]